MKIKHSRPDRPKCDLLMITDYFTIGDTKVRCLFDSRCEGILMSSEFAHMAGLRMQKLDEPVGYNKPSKEVELNSTTQ